MQPRAVPFLHLFDRKNLGAKASELDKFLLDCLQTFLPLDVSDLSLRAIPAMKLMFFVQFLNLSNLLSETRNFFPKNSEVIHTTRIVHFGWCQRWCQSRLRA